jgi:hypothetical protein
MTPPRSRKRVLREGRRAALVLAAVLALLVPALASRPASAADASIALGAVSGGRLPGTDASIVKTAAEGELRRIDRTKLPSSRALIVSLAVAAATDAPVACTVNATVHDARTGAMLVIVEGRARTEGRADGELQAAVVRAAVKSAVSRIPEALPRR